MSKTKTATLALLVSSVVAAAAHAAPAPTAAKLPITAARIHELIKKYAPVMFFHPEEKYFPTSIEWYLARTKRVTHEKQPALALKDRSAATVAGSLADAKAYVNAKIRATTTDLQFWLIHAYNGPGTAYWKKLNWRMRYDAIGDSSMAPCGEHEGDFEHFTLRVDNKSGKLVGLYLSQHHEGGWTNIAANHPWNQGKRMELFSSKNGHAIFTTADRHYYAEKKAGVVEFRLVNLTGRGKSLDLRRYELIGAHGPDAKPAEAALGLKVPSYRSITGRWGLVEKRNPSKVLPGVLGSIAKAFPGVVNWVIDKSGLRGECFEGWGPSPPWAKESWLGNNE